MTPGPDPETLTPELLRPRLDTPRVQIRGRSAVLLDHLEVEYDGTSEPYAYLVGWTAGWLWKGCQES